MPLEAVCVNLWKSWEVSYLQLDSYSTASFQNGLCVGRERRQYGSSGGTNLLLAS